ncbi:MAG: class I SAM-dependent methyltransferase [Candidatus Omnitrophica bacterium]|nr:class I SAM-dependent methyltransferase [Candidatus Omnitrophota bacterium]
MKRKEVIADECSIRTEFIPDCLLCGRQGVVLYEKLRDRIFSVPGLYNFFQCSDCGLAWLNPQPLQEDILKCYEGYFKHASLKNVSTPRRPFAAWRKWVRLCILHAQYNLPLADNSKLAYYLGYILGKIPVLLRKAAYNKEIFPPWSGQGRLLDVGCGNGHFLAFMQRVGWKVYGVEIDPEAAAIAKETHNVCVYVGTLQGAGFSDEFFDAITMSHVIEHLPDGFDVLKECHRILMPGGYLCIATPNLGSWGQSIFKKYWLALDPPRHLYLWTPKALSRIVEKAGFKIIRCNTFAKNARLIFTQSRIIRIKKRVDFQKKNSFTAHLFCWLETVLNKFVPNRAEDLIILARKEN